MDAGLVPFIVIALSVSIAGGLGSVARFALSKLDGTMPWGILAANVMAALLASNALFASTNGFVTNVVVIGFAGGLSTFSTVSAQSHEFITQGQHRKMIWNNILQFGLPMVAVLLVAVVYISGVVG
ncbi:MAG: fluoride efflux transporter FluC [Microbacteriaceae bacterium]